MDSCSDCSCHNGVPSCTAADFTCTVAPNTTPSGQTICGWSQWMNSDTPTSGNGDVESLSTLRIIYHLCASPVQIECRNAATQQPVNGNPSVTCNVQTGLTCDNSGHQGPCADYEIRVYCPCGGRFSFLARVSNI